MQQCTGRIMKMRFGFLSIHKFASATNYIVYFSAKRSNYVNGRLNICGNAGFKPSHNLPIAV